MKFTLSLLCYLLIFVCYINAQTDISYYLPSEVGYDKSVPTPKSVIGYEVGDWHVSHDQLVYYMNELAEKSSKVKIQEYARSHENRPLKLLTITSEKNHKNLDKIKEKHLDNVLGKGVSHYDNKLVVYLGYTVHGNESSGSNAAMLVAYYLAAAESKEVEKFLEETIILLDPCFNPDGMNRFANWVNRHKNKNLNPDNNDREYHEVWPGGRTNHYWFDLNRDWLLLQHPESIGRIKMFHEWKPNVLTDAHEMGTNSTYFFQPGIPSRNNPLTPERTFELTQELAIFHAKALDSIGTQYYSRESFDDFYIGKGSTYPDINACVGILFEQASSRGHLQHSINGTLSFPQTIKNQFNTSLSTLRGAVYNKKALLDHQKEFYKSALNQANSDNVKGYVFGDKNDLDRTLELYMLLKKHKIEVYPTKIDINDKGINFSEESSFIVPTSQPNYRLVKSMFEKVTTFNDSLFYDVSTWHLPSSFNLPYASLNRNIDILVDKVDELNLTENKIIGKSDKTYAYLIDWSNYYTPKLLNKLLHEEYLVKVANAGFTFNIEDQNIDFKPGTLMVPVGSLTKIKRNAIANIISKHIENYQTKVYAVETGMSLKGIDLGSPSFSSLKDQNIAVVVGNGVNAYEAGEVWHLMDQRMDVPLTHLDIHKINSINLDKYGVIILVDGNYDQLNIDKIKNWIAQGGTLITYKRASKWIASKDFCKIKIKAAASENIVTDVHKNYDGISKAKGAQHIGGTIFEGVADLSHPLFYGYSSEKISLFKNHKVFFEKPSNEYARPLNYSTNSLISGYVSSKNLKQINGSPALICAKHGSGKIIAFADNPNFRAFWFGTNKMFLNAIYFGKSIRGSTLE